MPFRSVSFSGIMITFLFIIIIVPRMGQKRITKRTLFAYQLAMKSGTRKSNQLKLVMMGAEGAGKTSSVGSLLNKQFNDNEISTVGASLNCCLTDRIFVSKWKQIPIADQLVNLPKLHKSSVKQSMPTMSSKVDSELHSSSNKEEELVPDLVAAHVQEVVNAKEVSDGDVRIVILDLGGQEIYYEVHFLFLAPEDIILLTFDASKSLDQPVISRQRIDRFQEKVATRGMQTNLEMLDTLFKSVYSYCGRTVVGYISNRIPTIIMMATHSGGLTDQEKKAIKLQFCKHFSDKPFFEHLPRVFEDAFHFVDNKFRDPMVFEKVKQVVLKAAKNTIEQEFPISYLQFEAKLLQASEDKPIISLQEAQDIAMAAGIEQDKLTEVLLHYCFKGILLYYPKVAALQNEVFVDPQEVSDLVSSVISTHNHQPSSVELNKSCTRYDTYGLLEERLLDDLLKSCGRLQQKEVVIALLQQFDLAIQVPVKTKYFDEDYEYDPPNSGRVFVVPSMLVYYQKMIYQKQAGDIVVLFHYPDKFLPENIFNHVLVKTVIWCIEEGHYIRR